VSRFRIHDEGNSPFHTDRQPTSQHRHELLWSSAHGTPHDSQPMSNMSLLGPNNYHNVRTVSHRAPRPILCSWGSDIGAFSWKYGRMFAAWVYPDLSTPSWTSDFQDRPSESMESKDRRLSRSPISEHGELVAQRYSRLGSEYPIQYIPDPPPPPK
jgi:hypothetical protein